MLRESRKREKQTKEKINRERGDEKGVKQKCKKEIYFYR